MVYEIDFPVIYFLLFTFITKEKIRVKIKIQNKIYQALYEKNKIRSFFNVIAVKRFCLSINAAGTHDTAVPPGPCLERDVGRRLRQSTGFIILI